MNTDGRYNIFIFAAVFISALFCCGVVVLPQIQPAATAELVSMEDLKRQSATAQYSATVTPFQPEVSITPVLIDTLESIPIVTEYVAPSVTPKPAVQVQRVTQIVTVLHTRIPADTPTPRPTATNTVSPLIVQLQHNQEMQRRNDLWRQRLKEWFISPFFLTLILVVGTFAGLWIYTLRWLARKTAPVTETREEILRQDESEVEHRNFIKFLWMHHTNGQRTYSDEYIKRQFAAKYRNKIYTGGDVHRIVSGVIAELEETYNTTSPPDLSDADGQPYSL